MAYADISAARAKLARICDGLRFAASGAVLERAAAKVQEQIDAVGKSKLSKHQLSGAALGSLDATASGGLVQLTSNRYLGYHRWWVFRDGMPPFVVSRAVKILDAELHAAVAGQPSPLFVADAAAEIAEEARMVKHRARYKAANAKIARSIARDAKRRAT